VDDYQLEIQQLRRNLARLREAEAEPSLIDEYEAEVRNHVALYEAARATFVAGEEDRRVAQGLEELGFGDWTLTNVYSFVYETAMELPLDGQELSTLIDDTDFAGSLVEVVTTAGP